MLSFHTVWFCLQQLNGLNIVQNGMKINNKVVLIEKEKKIQQKKGKKRKLFFLFANKIKSQRGNWMN